MKSNNLKQIKAIEQQNKNHILKVCPMASEASGIYIFTRSDGVFKYAYVGQAKHLLLRLASHLAGFQRIDISIRKRGFFSTDNQGGWQLRVFEFSESKLDEEERFYIAKYASLGYQLYNITSGGQGEGKTGIGARKPSKGYHDGLKQGYENARKEVDSLFEKWLIPIHKGTELTKNHDNALRKFYKFLKGENT